MLPSLTAGSSLLVTTLRMSVLYSQLSAGVDRLKLFELPERDFHITRVVTGLESLMIRHDMAGQGQESDRNRVTTTVRSGWMSPFMEPVSCI